eukprot:3516513-Amphidinium_carterae.1
MSPGRSLQVLIECHHDTVLLSSRINCMVHGGSSGAPSTCHIVSAPTHKQVRSQCGFRQYVPTWSARTP